MSRAFLIETTSAKELEEVFDRLSARGLKKEDYQVYLPFPSHRLLEKLRPDVEGLSPGIISAIGGLLGFLTAASFQVYPNVYGYPLRVGGHAHFSWHAFLIICIEMTILFGSLALLFYLIYHLFRRRKEASVVMEGCPSQMYGLKLLKVRASYQEELERLKTRFRVLPWPGAEEEKKEKI
mgnify:CR=1 FL=1